MRRKPVPSSLIVWGEEDFEINHPTGEVEKISFHKLVQFIFEQYVYVARALVFVCALGIAIIFAVLFLIIEFIKIHNVGV